MTDVVAVEGQCNAHCEAEQGMSGEKQTFFFPLCLCIYYYEQDCKESPADLPATC